MPPSSSWRRDCGSYPAPPRRCIRSARRSKARGEWSKARERYLAALRLKPEYPEAHNNLGLLLLRQGRAAEALPHLEETVRLDPESQQAREDLADCLRALGRREEAPQELRQRNMGSR
jgi:protein O-GlcNAc transferase